MYSIYYQSHSFMASEVMGYIYLDPPFGCQISAPNGLFLVGFLGAQISDPWRIQVYILDLPPTQ